MKIFFILTILLIFCFPAFAQTYTVDRVLDGDDLLLSNGEDVHLLGIDCPDSATDEGKRAKEFVRELVEGKEVRLELDVGKRDEYGRLLAYVYYYFEPFVELEIPEDWYIEFQQGEDRNQQRLFLNATIIKAGYASPQKEPPNVKYADLFQGLHEEAKEQGRGLWSIDKTEAVGCTMEAKMCPDGSFVGRVPPDCEFRKCPE